MAEENWIWANSASTGVEIDLNLDEIELRLSLAIIYCLKMNKDNKLFDNG